MENLPSKQIWREFNERRRLKGLLKGADVFSSQPHNELLNLSNLSSMQILFCELVVTTIAPMTISASGCST